MFPALVDEVDEILGDGPEDLKTLMNNASINGYAIEASLARLPFKIYIMHSMKQRKFYYDEKMVHHGQRAACLVH